MPPRGVLFYLGTWTGRLIIVNTIIFLWMAWQSKNLILPTDEVIVRFGAKDPARLVLGEYWRFFTPMFVHIGLLHYAFNTWALYNVGYHIEMTIRGRWFLVVYLLAGVWGNIASALMSVNISAGASTSLFGLLGCGFYIERLVSQRIHEKTGVRRRGGAYTAMVVMNLALGFFIPQLDNAAHLGGLAAGIFLTAILLRLEPNSLRPVAKRWGLWLSGIFALLTITGMTIGSSKEWLVSRLRRAIHESTQPQEVIALTTEGIAVEPQDGFFHWERAKVWLNHDYLSEVGNDVEIAYKDLALRNEIDNYVSTLKNAHREAAAEWLQAEIVRLRSSN